MIDRVKAAGLKKSLLKSIFIGGVVVAGLSVAGVSAASAQDAAAFYKGKQFRFISTSGAGGGYDAYSRLLSRHIADHIPGKPSLVFENMPGASGIRGTNYMFNIAPKDGTVMAGTYNTLLTDPLLGDSAAKYDPTKFEWIGSITTQYNSCMVWAASPIKTIEDAMKQEVKVSTTGMTGNSALTPFMLNKLIGTKFKLIAGYTTTDMRFAVERGEVDGICGFSYDTYQAANPDWLEHNRIRFILQTGTVPNKYIPDVPLLKNYVKDPKDIEALKILGVNEDVGRPHMFPPGVPKYLVTALRRAFDDTMKDPKFLADAGRMHIEPDPMTGEAIEKEMIDAYKAPKEAVARAAELWPPPVPGGKE
jgi:tripartite-type tricarboxylate transporter receptor subunit TctC